MKVEIINADDVRIKFEASVTRVGAGLATKAFSRAMNGKGRIAFNQVKRVLAQQTSIDRGTINAGVKFKPSSPNRLETRIIGTGRHIPLIKFGAVQFKIGTRAKVWGKLQTYPHSFIVPKYGGVYRRTGAKRFPIKQLYGPAIPVEIVKDASLATFQSTSGLILAEAVRLLGLMVSGAVK